MHDLKTASLIKSFGRQIPLIDKTELRQYANMFTANYSNDVITEAHDSCLVGTTITVDGRIKR